jgi:3-hydroxyisobutyrate dehydrogenase
MTHIAFLGLGAMGSRMAKRLLQAEEFSLSVWNRSPAAMEEFANTRARIGQSPADTVRDADFVISMLTDDIAAREVWLGEPSGALAAMKPGAIAVESSTVSPDWVHSLGSVAGARGVDVIDAPVAGSRPQAEAGQLIFMLGGKAATIERVRNVLKPMAAAIHAIGDVGKGATLKLAVNALFAAQLQSVAELLGFLSKSGIEAPRAAELLAQFPVTSGPAAIAAKLMAAQTGTRLFTVDLLEKDLGYAISAANAVSAELPGAARTRESFDAAKQRGWGNENFSSIARLFA